MSLTIEPYQGPGPRRYQPAYTHHPTGTQLLVEDVKKLTLNEIELRAFTTHPYAEEGHQPDSIWAAIWIEHLTATPPSRGTNP